MKWEHFISSNFLHFLCIWIWPPFFPFPKVLQFSLKIFHQVAHAEKIYSFPAPEHWAVIWNMVPRLPPSGISEVPKTELAWEGRKEKCFNESQELTPRSV